MSKWHKINLNRPKSLNRMCVFGWQELSSARAQEIFSKIDLDANGDLSQEEFMTGCLQEQYLQILPSDFWIFVRFQKIWFSGPIIRYNWTAYNSFPFQWSTPKKTWWNQIWAFDDIRSVLLMASFCQQLLEGISFLSGRRHCWTPQLRRNRPWRLWMNQLIKLTFNKQNVMDIKYRLECTCKRT